VELLSQLVPSLLQDIVLLRYLNLTLVRMVKNSHGSLQLPVHLLLSCLKNGYTGLHLKLLVESSPSVRSSWTRSGELIPHLLVI